jgi:hypothetical protein
MRYVLSNNQITSDIITYIKDCILIELKLDINEIPYFIGGTRDILENIENESLRTDIENTVNNLISRLTQLFPDIPINLGQLSIETTTVNISININNIPEHYQLTRNY